MTQVFTQRDQHDMLVAAYAMGEVADLVDFMPGYETQEAIASILEDVCPADPPPPKPDWSPEAVQLGVGYAAGYWAQMHVQCGRDAVERYIAYEESRA